jgi:ribosomal-protein-alanine N-acetyltransferase
MLDLERASPAAAHWPRQQYEGLFVTTGGQQSSERLAWVAEDDCAAAPKMGLSEATSVLAFLVAHRVETEWELENIVVAGAARRRGVGTGLLNELIAHARAKNGSGIFLEVRESNQSARGLYRKMGFEETGRRKGYYANPAEDAILGRLKFVKVFS